MRELARQGYSADERYCDEPTDNKLRIIFIVCAFEAELIALVQAKVQKYCAEFLWASLVESLDYAFRPLGQNDTTTLIQKVDRNGPISPGPDLGLEHRGRQCKPPRRRSSNCDLELRNWLGTKKISRLTKSRRCKKIGVEHGAQRLNEINWCRMRRQQLPSDYFVWETDSSPGVA